MRALLPAVLLCALAAPALAQEQPPGTVTAQATARTRVANTVADVRLGVEARARTVAAIHQALADGAAPLLAYLRGAGAVRLRTEQVSVTPETDTGRGSRPDRILGYTGRLRVSFRVPVEKLPLVLGGALDKGANTVEDTFLLPRESDVETTRRELAAEAVRAAMAQAQTMAEAAGRRLGAVRQITAGRLPDFAPQPAPMLAAARGPAPAPIATEAGESELAASVTVVVNLVEP